MKTKNLFSDIIVKLNELQAMNEIDPVYTFGSADTNSLANIMKRQNKLMDEIKTIARAHQTLLGRTVRFPMADSYAVYVVTKVNKTSVHLTWLKYCDAWVDDRLGYQGSISKDYVQKQCDFDDAWSKL